MTIGQLTRSSGEWLGKGLLAGQTDLPGIGHHMPSAVDSAFRCCAGYNTAVTGNTESQDCWRLAIYVTGDGIKNSNICKASHAMFSCFGAQ